MAMAIPSSLLPLEFASLPFLSGPRPSLTLASFGLPPRFFKQIRLSSNAKLPHSKLPDVRAIEQDEALSSGADEDEELKRRLQELGAGFTRLLEVGLYDQKCVEMCLVKSRSGDFRYMRDLTQEGKIRPGRISRKAESYHSGPFPCDSLKLPYDYLGKLPHDLRVDLTDAAFALSSGSLNQECGKRVGEILIQLSRSWEQADTQASMVISKSIFYLHHSLPNDMSSRAAIGRRFVKSGGFLAATGQYERGELQKIGNALIAVGKALLTSSTEATDVNDAMDSLRILKFGDLQVELTSARAFTGSTIAFFFGILSWKLASALQSIPESSINYANDNAVLLATSLRGVLLALGYSSTALSAFVMLSLAVLGIQLTSSEK